MTSTALVQGGNRGLGLAFVRILAQRGKVVATCRNPGQAHDLQTIPNVEVLQLDVTNHDDILKASELICKQKYHQRWR